ncbi:MAG TPA: alpha/beta hydrolase [Solirubrobacterales bacterium]|nr:alpha/beta hydrolase [Solirubrobacterales bacterium]
MRRPTRRPSLTAACALLALALAGCGGAGGGGDSGESGAPVPSADGGPASGERVSIPGAGEALIWGEGRRAVLLAHGAAFDAASWQPQAEVLAEDGSLVVALEGIDPDEIVAAVEYLRADLGAETVTLIGASAGADASLVALNRRPALTDQLITLSLNSTVPGLGPQPKLLIASEDEAVAGESVALAETAPGDGNEALLLPGSAHAQAIFDTDQGERALRAIRDQVKGLKS